MQRSKMLLLSSVALMACISVASAQSIKEGGAGRSEHGMSSQSSPGAAQPGGEMRRQGRAESRGEGADRKASSANEEKPGKSHGQAANERRERSTTGQGSAEKSEAARGSESKVENKGGAGGRNEGMTQGRNSQALKKKEKSTTGQASSNKNESTAGRKATERNEANKSQSQQERSSHQEPAKSQSSTQQSEQSQTKSSKSGEQNRTAGTAATQSQQTTGAAQNQQGPRQQTQTATQQSGTSLRSQAGATITTQQQSRIQQSVLSARNVPRVNDVNFDVRTDAVVPSHVHVVGVSSYPVLVEAFPRYRDDSFFVVEDEIIIVDHSRRIVDVVPVGPRAHFARGGSATTTSVALDLSEPEIRELQQVLIDRGYYHGRVDGVFGPEMREALISFQRKEGFEATGRIDSRTVSALGLSGRIRQNAQGAADQPAKQTGTQSRSERSDTTGQAAPQRNQSQNRTDGVTNSTSRQPNASNQSSQGKEPANQSSQNNQSAGSKPSTTGQGNQTSERHGSSMKPHAGRPNKQSPSEK